MAELAWITSRALMPQLSTPIGRAILAGTVTVALGCAAGEGAGRLVGKAWERARDVWNRARDWLWSLLGYPLEAAKKAIEYAAAALESVGLGAIAQLFRGANRMLDGVWGQLNQYRDLAVGAILFYVIYRFFLRR